MVPFWEVRAPPRHPPDPTLNASIYIYIYIYIYNPRCLKRVVVVVGGGGVVVSVVVGVVAAVVVVVFVVVDAPSRLFKYTGVRVRT